MNPGSRAFQTKQHIQRVGADDTQGKRRGEQVTNGPLRPFKIFELFLRKKEQTGILNRMLLDGDVLTVARKGW